MRRGGQNRTLAHLHAHLSPHISLLCSLSPRSTAQRSHVPEVSESPELSTELDGRISVCVSITLPSVHLSKLLG